MGKRSAAVLVAGWVVAAYVIAAGCSGSADTGQVLDAGTTSQAGSFTTSIWGSITSAINNLFSSTFHW